MTDHWFEKREKRIDEILGRIRKTGFIQKQPLGHVVKDIVYVMHFLHEASVDEQVRETLAYFRMQERERIQDNGWDCRKIEGEELKDPAKLGLGEIAKGIEIERERLAKEAKAAKKAEKPKKVKPTKAEKKPKGMEQWEWIDRIRHYEVNGVKLKTRTDHLTVKRILTQASMFSDTCVDADLLTEYDLTRVGGKKDGFTYSNLDREIRVRDGDKFIAIYHGKTPVA